MDQTLGVVGFGNFGKFLVKHLLPFFEISVFDQRDISTECEVLGVRCGSLSDVVARDVVVLAIPVQYLEAWLKESSHLFNPKALVVDVSSVKVKPVELMLRYLPETVEIVGTHPLFGPESGKHGITGLNIVLCEVRTTQIDSIRCFLTDKLSLNVIESTPQEHDQQMAYVQALTHFVSRALKEMKLPDVPQKTPTYQSLLHIQNTLGNDSEELFRTIQTENSLAQAVRQQFLNILEQINRRL